jgi:hypothetical protein
VKAVTEINIKAAKQNFFNGSNFIIIQDGKVLYKGCGGVLRYPEFIGLFLQSFSNLSSTAILPGQFTKLQVRTAVSVFFFCQGLAFASWASRIPDIKTSLHLSEAGLGTLLLSLPIGQLVTMPLSGRLVTRFGSKHVLQLAAIGYVSISDYWPC